LSTLPKSQGYDIDPVRVGQVLKRTLEVAKDLRVAGLMCDGNMSGAAETCQSGLIISALNDFGRYHEQPLKEVARRVEACPRGAYVATKAYIDGDRDMFERAQHLAQLTHPDVHEVAR
jgi:hypothetical protein